MAALTVYSCEGQKSSGLWDMAVFTSLWGQEATNLASSESLDSATGHSGTYESPLYATAQERLHSQVQVLVERGFQKWRAVSGCLCPDRGEPGILR